MKIRIHCVIGCLAAMLCEQSAAADDPQIRFKLPDCPTEMTLIAPKKFSGASPQADLLKTYEPFMFEDTQTVLAVTSPEYPDTAILVVEPNGTREVQGTITSEQFGRIKAAMLAKNPSNAVMQANQILQSKDTSIDEYDGVVQSSAENSATVTLVLDGRTTGANFSTLNGFKIIYADKCVVGIIFFSPKSSLSRRDFEEIVQFITVR